MADPQDGQQHVDAVPDHLSDLRIRPTAAPPPPNTPTVNTPDVNAQAKAELPQPKYMAPAEDLTQGTKLGQAYDNAKKWLGNQEESFSSAVLAPFRHGLDNMAEDLQNAGETGHTKSGGQLTGPTRALASGVGTALKFLPIGKDVKETALMSIAPPELGPEGRLLSKEVNAAEKTESVLHHATRASEETPVTGVRSNRLITNGSGESAASQEAINRVKSEKAQGKTRVSIDTRSGKETPLIGADAVDAKPATPYHRIVERGPKGEVVVAEGDKALRIQPHTPAHTAASKPSAPEKENVGEYDLGDIDESPKGTSFLSDVANAHNKENGLPEINPAHVEEDPRRGDIADAYKAAKHSPDDPAVKKSYDALKSDVDKQFDLAIQNGMKIDVKDENPYKGHEDLHDDVLNNKHLSVWSGGAPPADHPLSGVDPKTGMTYNEKFRAVHDIFGHAAEKADFSPGGEETAWNLHRQMFSHEARPALATETRGQAAYTYKYGDFPPQKAAILPEELQGRAEDAKNAVEQQGLVYKGEVVKGSNVHQFEHPDYPGKTASLKSPLTPENVSAKMESKLKELKDAPDATTIVKPKEPEVLPRPSVGEWIKNQQQGKPSGETPQIAGTGGTFDTIQHHKENVQNLQERLGEERKSGDRENAAVTQNELSEERELLKKAQSKTIDATPATAKKKTDWADKAADTAKQFGGGFTIHPKSGFVPNVGHAAEIYPEARRTLDNPATAEDIRKFHADHKDLFDKHPELHVGGFENELNISGVSDNRAGAEWVGRKLGQKSLWDFKAQQEIPTGGTGIATKFNYPLEDRIRDMSGKGFKEQQKAMPTINQLRSAIRAGKPFSEWWPKSRDAIKTIAGGNAQHADEIGQFLAAVSAHKQNDVALHIALNAWADWAEKGRPRGEGVAEEILGKYGPDGALIRGPNKSAGVDVQTLDRFLTGKNSLYNPDRIRYSKLGQEGLVLRGDDAAVVLDSHMQRVFGGNKLEGKAYFAGKDLMTKAAQAEGIDPAAGQAASWAIGRLFGGTTKPLTVDEALRKIGAGDILKQGEDYAELIATDPELRRAAERTITLSGGDVEQSFARLDKIANKAKPGIEESKAEASSKILRGYAKELTGERPSRYQLSQAGGDRLGKTGSKSGGQPGAGKRTVIKGPNPKAAMITKPDRSGAANLGKSEYPSNTDAKYVTQYVRKMAPDFTDVERIQEHPKWKLIDIDPNKIKGNYGVKWNKVNQYAAKGSQPPPVVLDHNMNVIDGMHRVYAGQVRAEKGSSELLGQSVRRTIKAFVPYK